MQRTPHHKLRNTAIRTASCGHPQLLSNHFVHQARIGGLRTWSVWTSGCPNKQLKHLNRSRVRVQFHSKSLNQHLLPTERHTDRSPCLNELSGAGLIYQSQTKPERLNPKEGKYFLTALRMKMLGTQYFCGTCCLLTWLAICQLLFLNSLMRHPKWHQGRSRLEQWNAQHLSKCQLPRDAACESFDMQLY